MDQNHENSFWKSNMRTVPGRPSPKKDHKSGKGSASTSSFESYQKSVMDAWNLSEDELTKEYCILSSEADSRLPTRRPQSVSKNHHSKNQLPVVHKASSTSSSVPTSSNNLTTTVTANSSMPANTIDASQSLSLDVSKAENLSTAGDSKHKSALNTISEKSSIEYG